MTIVVTGSSGLLGRHVAAALIEAGHDVTGVDTAPPPVPNAWRHISADLTDLGSAVELWGVRVPVNRIAAAAGTIAYELLCNVKRARFEYVDD